MSSTLRVRQILEGMDSVSRANLKKQLPSKLTMPTVETHKYPSALLNALPKEQNYSYLGIIAEHMLRLPVASITLDTLISVSKACCPVFGAVEEGKVRKSKTTQPFLDCLVATRTKVESLLRAEDGPLEYEPRIVSGSVEGHPDMKNTKQIFEVKLTGLLKSNWSAFLAQLFAYGAICTEATDLYLVLPLQKTVLAFDVRGWTKRAAYMGLLSSFSTKTQTVTFDVMMRAQLLIMLYGVGSHTKKQPLLLKTIQSFEASKPYQIFLSGPQNSNIKVDDADLAASLACITERKLRVYVHSQYIINLCAKTDDWNVQLLIKNLQVTRAFGGKGVVVHVGKSTGQPIDEALKTMRAAVVKALEHATADCPILIETPAGQGTETLTDRTTFLDFVDGFKDPRVRMCLDTCHVYACGHSPVEYIEEAKKRGGDLLQLVHYNDSLGDCGSCVDRHAFVGTGKIGLETMTTIAEVCSAARIPMLIE